MKLSLRIDVRDSAAPYEQICRQVVAAATDGSLPVGTKLPSVRALATNLGLAPGTVAKAYTQLEQAGIVEGRGRAGTFVSAGGDQTGAIAADAASQFAAQTRHLGLGTDELIAIVRAALDNA